MVACCGRFKEDELPSCLAARLSICLAAWLPCCLAAWLPVGVSQEPRLSYLSFPCRQECILGVARVTRGGRKLCALRQPVAGCGNLWRRAVAPLQKISCLTAWLFDCLAAWLLSCLAAKLPSCLAA